MIDPESMLAPIASPVGATTGLVAVIAIVRFVCCHLDARAKARRRVPRAVAREVPR